MYDDDENHQIFRNFIIPYYRVYFNDKNGIATGTYIEGNCAFYSMNIKDNEDYYENFNDGNENNYFKEKKVNIGVGFAVGKKWRTQSNWVLQFNLGFGRNFSYNKYNYY